MGRTGKLLASTGYDKTVKLWDVEQLEERATRSAAGADGAVRLWSLG